MGPRSSLGLLAFLATFVGLLAGFMGAAAPYPPAWLGATAAALLVLGGVLGSARIIEAYRRSSRHRSMNGR